MRAQRNIDLTADNMQALGVKKDTDGMYRCYGRFTEEYPVFIPRDGELTEPLIRHYHQKCLHGGVSMTMSEIRKDFWISTLRRLSKKIIKQCNICKVFAANPYDPPATRLLPDCRLNITYGFHTAGVDFIGPFICCKRRQKVKTYLIIITCALTRAVWLGVTKTMKVDEFKDKLNQFISNCVRPAEIISDNAKTFGAMANWIKRIRRNEKLHDYLAREGIIWKFNLSKAPWWVVQCMKDLSEI